MVAHESVSSKVYKKASLKALNYFKFASSAGVSLPSAIRIKDGEFRKMLEILEQGGTRHAPYHESVVKPLEENELVNCDHVSGYCKVTDEGIKVVEKFNNATRRLDEILGVINKIGIEAFDKKYVIQEGVKYLIESGILYHPFIPEPKKYKNPFIQAFIEAGGELRDFIPRIVSFPHPSALLIIANHIISYKTRYETYALTCKDRYRNSIGKETKEILEILRNGDIYPTGERIKETLRYYMKEYDIPWFKSPIQTFVASGLIGKVGNETYCICGITKHYEDVDNRYKLTKRGEKLATYMALHILLS